MLLRVGLGLRHLPSCFMPNLAKRSWSRSHSLHDSGRGDKKGHRDTQKQGYKTSERYASDQVSDLALTGYRGWKVFLSKLLLTWSFPAILEDRGASDINIFVVPQFSQHF